MISQKINIGNTLTSTGKRLQVTEIIRIMWFLLDHLSRQWSVLPVEVKVLPILNFWLIIAQEQIVIYSTLRLNTILHCAYSLCLTQSTLEVKDFLHNEDGFSHQEDIGISQRNHLCCPKIHQNLQVCTICGLWLCVLVVDCTNVYFCSNQWFEVGKNFYRI